MFVAPCTSTGTSDLPVKALIPNLPKPPVPHVHTVPSDLRMIVPRAPPQREITSAANAIESDSSKSRPTTPRCLIFMQPFQQPTEFASHSRLCSTSSPPNKPV